MRQVFITLILLAMAVVVIAGVNPRPEYALPNTLIICFNAQAINSIRGEINVERDEQGQIQLGLPQFDEIARTYGFIDIQRRYALVLDPEWEDTDGAHLANIFTITLEEDDNVMPALQVLQKQSFLIWADIEALKTQSYIPNDPLFQQQWHHPSINTIDMWDYIDRENYLMSYDPDNPDPLEREKEVVLAIVDSGTKWNHPDLRYNMWQNAAELAGGNGMTIDWNTGNITGANYQDEDGNGAPDDAIGYAFAYPMGYQSYQSYSGNTHGTHVAGCAAAIGDNDIGLTGTAMMAKLLCTRGTPTNQSLNTIQGGDQAMQYAVTTSLIHHFNVVINCSFGGPGQGAMWTNVVNNAVANGAIVVVAAGNDGWDIATCDNGNGDWPANVASAITVAAYGTSGNTAYFTNYGDNVDIVAPGMSIYSTYYSGSQTTAQNTYSFEQGTSMASPVAAGVIANMWAVNPTLTAAQVETILRSTGTQMPQNETGPMAGKLGGGRLNAFKAVFSEVLPLVTMLEEPIITEFAGNGDGLVQLGETLSISTTFTNDVDWNNATDMTVELVSSVPGVTIVAPSTISVGNLAAGASTTTLIFTAELALHVNTLDIPFAFIIRSNQEVSNMYPYSNEIPFTARVSNSKPNWPFQATGGMNSAPVVHNFGNGNRLVTVVGVNLYLIDAENNIQDGFPVNVGSTNGKLAIGDVNNDGRDEIVVTTANGTVKVISRNGVILYETPLSSEGTIMVRSSTVLADLNGDGQLEVIVVGSIAKNIYILNGNDLSPWASSPIEMDNSMSVNIAVGDLDNDGIKEIAVATPSSLSAYNPVTGQLLAGFPVTLSQDSAKGPTIADIDGQNDNEIIFAGQPSVNCPLYIYKKDGSLLRSIQVSGAIRTEIAVIDLYGNHEPLIAFGTQNGYFHLKNSNLQDMPGFPLFIGTNVAIYSSPVFADLDADNVLDIIFGDNNGYLHIVKADGTYVPGYPIKIASESITMAPWVGKFSADTGFADILLISQGKIEFINTQRILSNPEPYAWNTFRGNIANTASTDYRYLSEDDIVATPITNALKQNYPNPFNPTTTINFSLNRGEYVRLAIYNIKGQIIKTLVNANLNSGEHSIMWNGLDEANQPVSSGIYFYRLQSDTFTQTRKMLMMK